MAIVPLKARAEALAWQGQKPSGGKGRSPQVAGADYLKFVKLFFKDFKSLNRNGSRPPILRQSSEEG